MYDTKRIFLLSKLYKFEITLCELQDLCVEIEVKSLFLVKF